MRIEKQWIHFHLCTVSNEVGVYNLYYCVLILTTSLVSELHDDRACNFSGFYKTCSHWVVLLHYSLYHNVHSLLHAFIVITAISCQ